MKLTELAIDRYGACCNVRLDRFTNGLNVLFGAPGTGKTSLQEYIRQVLYGFTKDAPQGDGHLICHHEGQSIQLSRPALATGKLAVANLSGACLATDAVQKHLQQLGPNFFDTIYHFDSKSDGQSIGSILHALKVHLGLGVGVTGSTAPPSRFLPSRFLQTGQPKIVGVDWNSTLAEIRTLENLRSQYLSEVVSNSSFAPTPRVDLEAEIDELTAKIAERDLQPLRDRINTIDSMVRETRELWESAEARNRPSELSTGTELLSACYDHLDDLDQQIGAWRELQSDIHAQRRRRRDDLEARIDCEEREPQHAYQPVRDLLHSLQQRLNDAEAASLPLLEILPHDGQLEEHPATQAQQGYEEVRKELGQLFLDLELENRKINQRVAAAELRRLRRHYNQIGERLEKLISRRRLVLRRIQKIDEHANSISLHSNPAYQHCAAEEGHWAARRRFLRELLVEPQPVNESEATRFQQRLAELKDERRNLVLQLVNHENYLGPLQTRLSNLCSQRANIAWDTQNTWDVELYHIENRLKQLEQRLTQSMEKPIPDEVTTPRTDPLLRRASQLASQMTLGEVTELVISSSGHDQLPQLFTEGRHQDRIAYESLRSTTQKQIALSLCLASVECWHRQGLKLPMLIDDFWHEMDPARTKATFQLLDRFCRQGIQVLLTTADRHLASLALDNGIRLHELTNVQYYDRQWVHSSPPQWVAVVEPATYLPEHRASVTNTTSAVDIATPVTYALADYTTNETPEPNTSTKAAVSATLPDQTTIPADGLQEESTLSGDLALEFAPLVDESTPLFNFELFTPSNSASLKHCGIHDVADLLKQDVENLGPDLTKHGFTPQIVETWQSIAWLMICVPGLRIEDAHLLRTIGISEPEQLSTTTSLQLSNRLQRVLLTRHDHPVQWQPDDFSTERINRWYRALDRTRSRWKTSTGYSRQVYSKLALASRTGTAPDLVWNASIEQPNPLSTTETMPGSTTPGPRRRRSSKSLDHAELSIGSSFEQRKTRTKNRTQSTLVRKHPQSIKFHLDLHDHVQSAPSVNKKTAERFLAIGVTTIHELLEGSATSMAKAMACVQISTELVQSWQHQAKLVCRIPNLRGHDAQILVACGITEPEMLSSMDADELLSIVEPFCETRQGIKIIRSGKKPDLEEVQNWIQWSAQNRQLQAA